MGVRNSLIIAAIATLLSVNIAQAEQKKKPQFPSVDIPLIGNSSRKAPRDGSVDIPLIGTSSRKAPREEFMQIGGNPGNPWDSQNKCYIGRPPQHYECPPGTRLIDLDPSAEICWRCEIPTD
ncbi:hypothetical protein [Thermosynechococcus vestitus]|uniref:hypothetical protein n=1 Tax=Thermosynechococcus vestitus TaxID=146786 RepID=UPI0013E8EF4D|nr:hypothetical protein [Thermosynechococcus vestitus]